MAAGVVVAELDAAAAADIGEKDGVVVMGGSKWCSSGGEWDIDMQFGGGGLWVGGTGSRPPKGGWLISVDCEKALLCVWVCVLVDIVVIGWPLRCVRRWELVDAAWERRANNGVGCGLETLFNRAERKGYILTIHSGFFVGSGQQGHVECCRHDQLRAKDPSD